MNRKSLPFVMHFDHIKNKVVIELKARTVITNAAGKEWVFMPGYRSDGHSVGKLFRHFDAYVIPALCHDQDCKRARILKSYGMWRQGDIDYRDNMLEIGAPTSTVLIRYSGVSARGLSLRLTRRLK